MAEMRSGFEVFKFKGVKMVGISNRPAGDGRFPAVLFLHGFPGSEKNVDVQRALLLNGVGSFALHFQGAWGSEGRYTFSGLVPQALAALKFLRAKKWVDAKRTALFGFSMGGWTAINAGALDRRVKGVVAIAPVGGKEMVAPGTRDVVLKHSQPLRIKSAASLNRDFARAVTERDPAAAAAALKCPLLLVHGTKDDVVPYPISQRIFAAARDPKTLVKAEGAAHDFLDRREWLTGIASQWLLAQLGVLSKSASGEPSSSSEPTNALQSAAR
jgi:uncharacterized protein